jgi:putrescine transport system substrate-binding protein
MVQARKRAQESNSPANIGYVIPTEGSVLWVTLLAIPRDAPHPANAHLFINFMLTLPVIAKITNAVGFANAVPSSIPYVDSSVSADLTIYPAPDQRKRLVVLMEPDPEINRVITRIWQRFKTGQ